MSAHGRGSLIPFAAAGAAIVLVLIVGVVVADVVGFSRLTELDEEGTHARLNRLRRELLKPKISEHHGRIIKNTGDGALVEFASVVDAVRCAVEIQRDMIERNADIPEDRRIVFRVGINLGDVIVEPDDIHGDGVNVATRLEGLAEPGGLCVSGTVHDQVRDKVSYAFTEMGEQTVKNISRPVRVYSLGANAIAALPASPPSMNTPQPSREVPPLWLAGRRWHRSSCSRSRSALARYQARQRTSTVRVSTATVHCRAAVYQSERRSDAGLFR